MCFSLFSVLFFIHLNLFEQGEHDYVTLAHIVPHQNIVKRNEYFGDKKIIVIDEANLYAFEELPEYWVVELRTEMPRDNETSIDQYEEAPVAEFDVWRKASLKLFNKWKTIPLTNVRAFSVERNELPIVEIQTDK